MMRVNFAGNIDQNQYVEKVRTLMDFIAPRILKEDIETIWRMQVGQPENVYVLGVLSRQECRANMFNRKQSALL